MSQVCCTTFVAELFSHGWYNRNSLKLEHHQLNGHEFEQTRGDGEGQEAWLALVHGISMSQIELCDWTIRGNPKARDSHGIYSSRGWKTQKMHSSHQNKLNSSNSLAAQTATKHAEMPWGNKELSVSTFLNWVIFFSFFFFVSLIERILLKCQLSTVAFREPLSPSPPKQCENDCVESVFQNKTCLSARTQIDSAAQGKTLSVSHPFP